MTEINKDNNEIDLLLDNLTKFLTDPDNQHKLYFLSHLKKQRYVSDVASIGNPMSDLVKLFILQRVMEENFDIKLFMECSRDKREIQPNMREYVQYTDYNLVDIYHIITNSIVTLVLHDNNNLTNMVRNMTIINKLEGIPIVQYTPEIYKMFDCNMVKETNPSLNTLNTEFKKKHNEFEYIDTFITEIDTNLDKFQMLCFSTMTELVALLDYCMVNSDKIKTALNKNYMNYLTDYHDLFVTNFNKIKPEQETIELEYSKEKDDNNEIDLTEFIL